MSIEQSLSSLRKSQIALLVIDAGEPITMQDKNLSREILENNKSLIFVINKWDLLKEKTTHSDKEYINALHRDFPFLTWAPVIFISAKSGFKIARLVDAVVEIYEQQHQTIVQSQLDKLLQSILKRKAPPIGSNLKRPYLHSLKQISTDPLTFEITATAKENIPYSYHRYIKNELREKFHYTGCGIKLLIAEKS